LLKFTKMHGLGNDYVYVDGLSRRFPDNIDWPSISRLVSPRHFSIGSDGLIVILPSQHADCRMRIFNADGSEGEMCGNGIRCLGKYVYEHNLLKKNPLSVETLAGIITLTLTCENESVELIEVDMGEPKLNFKDIPLKGPAEAMAVNVELPLKDGLVYYGTGIRIGPPHFVVEVNDVEGFPVKIIGKLLENHELLPQKANIDFVQVIDRQLLKMRVWERGSGETLACGTGACAALVATSLANKTEAKATVVSKGGSLFIRWDKKLNRVFMKGSAVEVYSGYIKIPNSIINRAGGYPLFE